MKITRTFLGADGITELEYIMGGIQAIFIQESYFINYFTCLFSLLFLRNIYLAN